MVYYVEQRDGLWYVVRNGELLGAGYSSKPAAEAALRSLCKGAVCRETRLLDRVS